MCNKSKYDPKTTPQLIKFMCRSGLIDSDIAKELGINRATLFRWKDKYPEVKEALTTSKTFIDSLVEDSLLKRALGYELDVVEETESETFKGIETKTTRKKTHIAADTTAIIFWLKNRQSKNWRDRHDNTLIELENVETPKIIDDIQ